MIRPKVIVALVKRAIIASYSDSGRLIDFIVFPVVHALLWAMLFHSGVILPEAAMPLFLVNCCWAIASCIQGQVSKFLLFDLWGRELIEMVRAGITPSNYSLAAEIYGVINGVATCIALLLLSTIIVALSSTEVMVLLATLPTMIIFAIAVASGVGAIVLRKSQTYGFLSWTIFQIIFVFSAPYTALANLPYLLKLVALLSPLTFAFEFLRTGASDAHWISLALAFFYFAISKVFFIRAFSRSMQDGRILHI